MNQPSRLNISLILLLLCEIFLVVHFGNLLKIYKIHQWPVMSDTSREHKSLLREDVSDEEYQYEFSSPRRHMGYKGKAKNTVKGAAAIIKNWPDHWTSSATYWWAGIAMFALLTFIFYSSVVTYSMLPTADSIPVRQTVHNNKIEKKDQKFNLPNVFMHVIVNNDKEAYLNKYLPYIEIVANKYLHYKFNLIIMLNDTFQDEEAIYEAEINNENALNSLWTEPNVLEPKVPSKVKTNIKIHYVNLSNYLEDSPLRQFWKQLPYQFIEFLVRAVSIWDKGGISFSPIILTPKSPHAIYIEKLYSLLSSYEELNKPNATTNVNHKIQSIAKPKILENQNGKYEKRVNNIRDIIDALETEAAGPQSQPEALTVAENRQVNSEVIMANNSDNANFTKSEFLTHTFHEYSNNNKTPKSMLSENLNNKSEMLNVMLPSFLDFLFHNKPKKATQEEESTDLITTGDLINRSTRSALTKPIQNNDERGNSMQPMIISAPTKFEKIDTKVEDDASINYNDLENLTIDLKGNILATKSSCHAFLGTIFSNVKHRTKNESLKDFIISELSLFCNGLLSTCKGVDVILL